MLVLNHQKLIVKFSHFDTGPNHSSMLYIATCCVPVWWDMCL